MFTQIQKNDIAVYENSGNYRIARALDGGLISNIYIDSTLGVCYIVDPENYPDQYRDVGDDTVIDIYYALPTEKLIGAYAATNALNNEEVKTMQVNADKLLLIAVDVINVKIYLNTDEIDIDNGGKIPNDPGNDVVFTLTTVRDDLTVSSTTPFFSVENRERGYSYEMVIDSENLFTIFSSTWEDFKNAGGVVEFYLITGF